MSLQAPMSVGGTTGSRIGCSNVESYFPWELAAMGDDLKLTFGRNEIFLTCVQIQCMRWICSLREHLFQ